MKGKHTKKIDKASKDAKWKTQPVKVKQQYPSDPGFAKEIKAELSKIPKEPPLEIPRVKNVGITAEYNVVKKERKATMTIAETKLGVTLVLSKEECVKIGLPGNLMTREAIKQIKAKLGLGK